MNVNQNDLRSGVDRRDDIQIINITYYYQFFTDRTYDFNYYHNN